MFDDQICPLDAVTVAMLRAANEMSSTLLITGGSGTGKSHLAHGLHKADPRRAPGRWFQINLATLSENLVESELFGHERGAFTGADHRRVGRLESCDGGTVFLDEIGELPIRLQAKILDFIQYKRICPVGSNREVELDVRIIAATNKDLEGAVEAREFRRDLYHRLNVFHVRLPDLASRKEHVTALARHFLAARAKRSAKPILGFHPRAETLLANYPWPGNIRELENAIEYAIAMENTREVRICSLPLRLQEYALENQELLESLSEPLSQAATGTEPACQPGPFSDADKNAIGFLELPILLEYHKARDNFEKAYLERVLRHYGGQINLTSRETGLNKVSLTEKIRKHQIDWRSLRTS